MAMVSDMIRRSGIDSEPAAYIAAGEWPDGELMPDAPGPVHYAKLISQRLRDALAQTSISALSRDADLSRVAIHGLLNGETWPEMVSLAKLELALDVRLWPDDATRDRLRDR